MGKSIYLFQGFLSKKNIPIGYKNKIQQQVYIGSGLGISIGSFCQINEFVKLKDVEIGDYVMLAPYVQILGGKAHNISDIKIPMVLQGEYYKGKIIIEEDVWIGTNAVIMPNVRIGRGSIVGANSVVTKNIEPFTIVGGVPAKIIKTRKTNDLV